MVILPDVRGLHPFFEELALRFAEAGVDAIAFDYFSRTAGTGKRDEAFDYQAHVPLMQHETLNQDVAAAAAYLRSPDGGTVAVGIPVDPLEATFVREVMDTDIVTAEPDQSLADLYTALPEGSPQRRQRLYPVLQPEAGLVGAAALARR